MNTTIKVDGMTCGHCVHAVTITSDAPLADDDVRAAIDEAGYVVVA